MQLGTLLSLIGALAAMVMIGIGLSRKISFDANVKKTLVTIILYIAMPCMIVNGLFQLPIDGTLLRQMGLVLVFSIVVHSAGMMLGWVGAKPLKTTSSERRELAVLGGLGNTGFIGIPVCAVLFGPKGALLAAVFDTGMDIVLWTYVVFMLKGRSVWSWRGLKSVLNAPMLAVITGLLLASLQAIPPAPVTQLLAMLGGTTVPLAMLYIGLLLAQLFKYKPQIKPKIIAVPVIVKLILLPVCIAVLLRLIGVGPELSQVIITQSAMPTLTIASIIFAQCSANEELAAVVTAASTLISVVTIPLMLSLLIG
jgi:predicted permease